MTTTLAAPAPPVAPGRPARLAPAVALAFGGAVAAVWITAAVLAAGRGYDLTDEGFYLLSYRWWAVDHRSFTGVAYVYGPVFDLLGHDVAALRLVRVATIAATHLLFGVAFMTWLRRRRPAAPPTRLWEAAGAAAILAAGGVTYSWLPATPGYNDVVLLGAMLGLAAVCVLGPRTWPLSVLGAVAVPVLLTKWAAVSVLLPVLLAAVVVLHGYGFPRPVRAAGWCMGGFAAAAALVHVLIVPLNVALPPLIEVNRLLAASSFAIPVLLERYWTTTRPTLGEVARFYTPLLLALTALAHVRRPRPRAAAPSQRASSAARAPSRAASVLGAFLFALGVAGFALATWHTMTAGGSANANQFLAPALAVALAGLVTLRGDRLFLSVLAVIPPAYAFGTSNAPLKISINALGIWTAILIAALTGLPAAHRPGRVLLTAVTAGALLASTCVGVGGAWLHPYRGRPNAQATAPVPGVPELASLRLDPLSARRYAILRARLAPYLDPPGRPIIALDKMPGLVFLLGGRTVGEGWYDPANRPRTAAGIRAACPTLDRRPLLILNRPMVPADRTMLGDCGTGYRRLAPPRETAGYTVYVPS